MKELVAELRIVLKRVYSEHDYCQPPSIWVRERIMEADKLANAIESLTGEGDLGEPPHSRLEVTEEVYLSAVRGRADFRTAFRREREVRMQLQAVVANFADEKNWSDKPANLRWDGKRHAIEYAQSTLSALQASEARGSSTPSPSEDELREVLAHEVARIWRVGDEDILAMIARDLNKGPSGMYPVQAILSAMRAILHRTHTSGETELEAAGNGISLR
jgi:hypothetical protein